MPFQPKKARNKVESTYKSIYLRQTVIDELNALAAKHNTSFNNIVATVPGRNTQRTVRIETSLPSWQGCFALCGAEAQPLPAPAAFHPVPPVYAAARNSLRYISR